MIKLSKVEDLYFNISSLILRFEPFQKNCEKNVLLCLCWWGLWSVIVDSCTPRRCGRGLWNLFEQGNQCLLLWRCVRAIYTLILKKIPTKFWRRNKLKMAKYRWNVTDSNKAIFDLINCGQASDVSAHKNYYTYLYRRNQWLKPLVSDTVWAIWNRVRKLHYMRIYHFYDKSVNARIHVTRLSFIIFFYFFFNWIVCENGELNKNEVNYSNINYIYL